MKRIIYTQNLGRLVSYFGRYQLSFQIYTKMN